MNKNFFSFWFVLIPLFHFLVPIPIRRWMCFSHSEGGNYGFSLRYMNVRQGYDVSSLNVQVWHGKINID